MCFLIATSVGADDLDGAPAEVVPASLETRAVLDVRAFCPPVMRPGATFQIPVSVRNRSPQAVTVTRGALGMYLGRATLTGPKAFSVSASMQGSASVGEAAAVDTTLDVLLPPSARTGTFVSLALSLFGRVGDSSRRHLLGATTCHIEVTAPDSVVLASIEVTPASATVVRGASQRFVARGRFSDGTAEEPLSSVAWTSDATSVAAVDASGSATAIAVGTARVRASRNGVVSPPAVLRVTPAVAGLVISPATLTLDVGSGLQFTATEVLGDGIRQDVTGVVEWRSDDPSVATADPIGFVRGIAAGVATITALHPSGITANATVTVTRRLQMSVTVAPVPLAIPPDNAPHTFAIRLSETDTIPHTVNLSVLDTTVASVSPASVTFAVGQTTAQASITGLRGGQTTLSLTSPTLLPGTSVPVFVTTEFLGINTALAPLLGVVLQVPPAPGPTVTIGPVRSEALGVIVGSAMTGVTPGALVVGMGPTPLVISGAGLGGVTSVTIVPAAGLTPGSLSVAPDGSSVTVPATVAADAALGVRQVVLTASGQRIAPTTPEADRIVVTLPAPAVESIDPLFAVPGTSGLTLTVRGRNLQFAQSVALAPAQDITVASSPAVNADGTQLTVGVTVSSAAAIGPRVVTVTTPAGSSDATPSPANTFTIVRELREMVTPIVSRVLGVVKEAPDTSSTQMVSAFAPALGVTLGTAATGLVPSTGTIGTSVTLTVQGAGLDGVTSIQFFPAAGLTTGAVTAAPDGGSATVDVAIALDAPQTLRTVRVLAGATPIAFSHPSAALFRVTAPAPQLDSVSPIVIQTGTTALTLTLRGRNLQNPERVEIILPADVTVSAPTGDADGTSVTVAMTVAASAAAGQRVVTVITPGGTSPTTSSAANTITLTHAIGATFTPVVAPVLGVLKQEAGSTAPEVPIGPILSPPLGVMLEAPPPETVSVTRTIVATALGVALGPVPTSLDPVALRPGTTGTLTIRGAGLAPVTSVSLVPAAGVTLGPPAVSADGSEAQVSFTVSAGEVMSLRQVVVGTAAGRVAFARPESALLWIREVPIIESISPIAVCTDTARLQLTVRGQHLRSALGVTATSPDGITFGSTVAVTVEGQEGLTRDVATVDLAIAPGAPRVARVIRVMVPGFVSTDQAEPANTLTVNDRPVPDTAGVCPGVAGSGG